MNKYLPRRRRLAEQSRASNPRVFGSVLRGRDTESSDLDILVDPLPGATLFDLANDVQILVARNPAEHDIANFRHRRIDRHHSAQLSGLNTSGDGLTVWAE